MASVATTGAIVIAGLGVLWMALPYLQKAPVVGRLFHAVPAGLQPSAGGAASDQYGRAA